MRRLLLAFGLLFAAAPAFAAMQAKPVEWSVGKDRFSGYVVYDDASVAKRPGLLMVPDWYGVTPTALDKARQQAGDDYVVLVVDMKAAIVPFEDEMDRAGADWQFVNFSGAMHCFALETANKPGCKYDPRAARRAYAMMHGFFAGRFALRE
ncbi:MAG: dienelactone hydrolase family protein [Xanthomonadaceae bacterium]|nr:dienelactone hydrolase family protein [Xanthomonadaceae bacterium]